VSRHMGLFAVSRLAVRHGVRVRLRPASPEGLSVLVWLPGGVIERVPHGYPTPIGWTHPFGTVNDRPALLRSEPSAPGASADSLSKWFRSPRISAADAGTGKADRPDSRGRDGAAGVPAATAATAARQGGGWYSGIDSWEQQRRAAEIIAAPIRGSQTPAGLPVRVPQANLIPGSAGRSRPAEANGAAALSHAARGYEAPDPLPQQSAELARSRLSGFQRGARRAESQQQYGGERTDS